MAGAPEASAQEMPMAAEPEMPAPAAPALPEGWAAYTDEASGHIWYGNAATGEKQWTPPEVPARAPAEPAEPAEQLLQPVPAEPADPALAAPAAPMLAQAAAPVYAQPVAPVQGASPADATNPQNTYLASHPRHHHHALEQNMYMNPGELPRPLQPAFALQPTPAPQAAIEVGGATRASATNTAKMRFTDRPPMTLGQRLFLAIMVGAFGCFFGYGIAACVMRKNTSLVLDLQADCPGGFQRHDLGSSDRKGNKIISPVCLSPELAQDWRKCQESVMPLREKIMKNLNRLEKDTTHGAGGGSDSDSPKLTEDIKATEADASISKEAGEIEAKEEAEEIRQDEEKAIEREEINKLDMWDAFAANPNVTSVVFPAIFVLAALWFFALKQFPRVVVYGSIGFSVMYQFYLMYLFQDSREAMVVPAISALGTIVLTFWNAKTINLTCRTATAACAILKSRPTVFVACCVLKAMWIIIACCLVWFFICGALTAEVHKYERTYENDPDGDYAYCELHHSVGVVQYLPTIATAFTFITWFLDMGSVLVCGVAMGTHYLHSGDPDAPQYPAYLGLQWVFSSSSGAVAESAVIMSIVTFVRQFLDSKKTGFWCCVWNPVLWVLKFIWWFLESTLRALSRFKLIMHGFHGGGLWTAGQGQLTLELLKKHLGKAVVAEVVGGKVLPLSAALMATALAMIAWVWLDYETNAKVFTGGYFNIYQVVFLVYLMFLAVSRIPKMCMAGAMIMTIYRDESEAARNPAVAVTQCGLFIGSLAMCVFEFFVEIVFHSIDGLLYAYAIEAECGQVDEKNKEALILFGNLIQEVKDSAAEQEAVSNGEAAVAAHVSYGAAEKA